MSIYYKNNTGNLQEFASTVSYDDETNVLTINGVDHTISSSNISYDDETNVLTINGVEHEVGGFNPEIADTLPEELSANKYYFVKNGSSGGGGSGGGSSDIVESIYPVGSIYIGLQETCPILALIPGSTWTKIEGRYLLGSGQLVGGNTAENYGAGTEVEPGLPQHTHSAPAWNNTNRIYDVRIESDGRLLNNTGSTENASNPIYGRSASVRPPSLAVNIWKRDS